MYLTMVGVIKQAKLVACFKSCYKANFTYISENLGTPNYPLWHIFFHCPSFGRWSYLMFRGTNGQPLQRPVFSKCSNTYAEW